MTRADDPIRVVVASDDHHGDLTGRTLLVDDATMLLSVPIEDDHPEPFEEVALWTAERQRRPRPRPVHPRRHAVRAGRVPADAG